MVNANASIFTTCFFWYAAVALTIFAPYLLLRLYIFATFVQIKSQATL